MVQRQRDRWPFHDKKRKFNPSKTRFKELRAALLDPKLGFTTPGRSLPESMVIGSADDSTTGVVDKGAEALGPLPTAVSDHAFDTDPKHPVGSDAEHPPMVCSCTHGFGIVCLFN